MIKDRFGGLYSILNRRDIQTLYHFEAWASDADISPEPELTTDIYYIDKSTGESVDDMTVQYLVTLPVEDILDIVKNWTGSLQEYCKEYQRGYTMYGKRKHIPELIESAPGPYSTDPEGNPGRYDLITTCYRWLDKLRPIIRKLERSVYKLRNEALD